MGGEQKAKGKCWLMLDADQPVQPSSCGLLSKWLSCYRVIELLQHFRTLGERLASLASISDQHVQAPIHEIGEWPACL